MRCRNGQTPKDRSLQCVIAFPILPPCSGKLSVCHHMATFPTQFCQKSLIYFFKAFALAESIARPGSGEASLYSVLRSSPSRAVRFASSMNAHSASDRDSIAKVVKPAAFDWEDELCKSAEAAGSPAESTARDSLIVDVGGGEGTLAKALLSRYFKLSIVVQDLPHVIEKARKVAVTEGWGQEAPAPGQGKVSFQAHSFFEPQIVHAAAAYVFRWVLRNWSDDLCIQILQNLVPALRTGVRILVNEACLPNRASSRTSGSAASHRFGRNADFEPWICPCWSCLTLTNATWKTGSICSRVLTSDSPSTASERSKALTCAFLISYGLHDVLLQRQSQALQIRRAFCMSFHIADSHAA